MQVKHSPEEWKEIIKEFNGSGLSQRKWCAIHGEESKRQMIHTVNVRTKKDAIRRPLMLAYIRWYLTAPWQQF